MCLRPSATELEFHLDRLNEVKKQVDPNERGRKQSLLDFASCVATVEEHRRQSGEPVGLPSLDMSFTKHETGGLGAAEQASPPPPSGRAVMNGAYLGTGTLQA